MGCVLAAIAGCTVGPDYVPVEPDAPTEWNTQLPPGLQRDPASLSQWWTSFDDPQLTALVERAVEGNLTLQQAAERVYEARAQRAVASAGQFPTLTASGYAMRSEYSQNSIYQGLTDNFYSAGFDASWELDLFGQIQRQIEVGDALITASEEAYRDVLVTLVAEVALNYVEVRLFQERLAVLKANEATQSRTLELVKANVDAGQVSRLDLEQSRTNLELTRSQIPSIETGLEQSKNRLAVLLGLQPGSLSVDLDTNAAIPVPPATIAVGVPAEALRRRPDVRRAERELAAQTAQIGVATADLYPKLQLLGSIGLDTMGSSDILSRSSESFGIGPSMQWAVFDAGRIRANIEVQTARQQQALLAYESAVLEALRSVEDAILAYGKEKLRYDALTLAEQAAARTHEIAKDRYDMGETSFLSVLDAERSLLSVQDQLAVSSARSSSIVIMLYKALGGGWSALAPEPAPSNTNANSTDPGGKQP
ncbi:MAG: efflux transporter outer membrane subunit [Phycisphaerales bacterium JB052]